MPVSYQILAEPDAVIAYYEGQVELLEVANMWRDYQQDSDFRLERPQIVDLKKVTGTNSGFAEIFSMFSLFANQYEAANAKLQVAVVTGNDVSFGLARIFENLAEQSDWAECTLCEEMSEAREWAAARPS